MSFSLLHPRDQIVATMDRIYRHNMTTTSGGNISVRDENGDTWITPARVDKGALRRQDIVCIHPDGTREGSHRPSSESRFHLSIYAARPDIQSIVHAHPGSLVSFSICGQVPNTRLFPEAWKVCGRVGFAPYALPGTEELGEVLAKEFGSPNRPNCVVLENHGVVVGGPDLSTAFRRFETLEFTAHTLINANQLGPVRYLEDDQLTLAEIQRNLMPHRPPIAPTSRAKELRKDLCDFVHRAYEHGLIASTWGSFSARIDRETFLITPTGIDRQELTLSDLVTVRDGERVGSHLPSRAVQLHRAIYQAHPQIKAIVNALPIHATAFCVSDTLLDTRIIPESYVFLRDVRTIPFADQFGDGKAIAAKVDLANPVALLEHNGVLVAGRSVLDAFDRLEVLEATAAALIRARPLGPIRPMSEAAIAELQRAFPSA